MEHPIPQANQNENSFRSAFEYSAIGMALTDAHRKFIEVNSSLCKIVGYDRTELLQYTFSDIAYPDDFEVDANMLLELIEGKRDNYQIEKRFIRKDGHVVWTLLAVSLIQDAGGNIVNFIEQVQDISVIKERAQQLIQSETQLRLTFEFSAIGMALVNADGEIIKVNNSLCKIIGYTENELLTLTFQDITHVDDLETDLVLLQELKEGLRQSYQMEKRYNHKDGHIVWALLAVSMIRNNDGEIITFIRQIQDISDLKEKTQQLRQSDTQLRHAFEFSAIGMALVDPESGRLNKISKSLTKLIGYQAEDFLTSTFREITHPDDVDIDLHLLKDLKEGKKETYQTEKRYIHKEGHILFALLAVSMMRDEDGKIIHFIYQIQDITILKENEAQLEILNHTVKETNKELVSKNEELREFAYIASHDLQEPLRAVSVFLSKIEKKYLPLLDEEGKKYIHFALDGATRMRQLILDILEYSAVGNSGKIALTDVDLNVVLKEVILIYKQSPFGQQAEIISEVLPVVKANHTSMHQLFSNLISNAVKYQIAGNIPVVKLAVIDKTEHWQFSINDNGIGIDEKGVNRIFNIFQRLHTEEQYPGTGIGLSICKRIVNQMKGKIWIESALGAGSTFYFTILK